MRISRAELDRLIEAEINEIFGFGKKEPSKEYPASEIAGIMKGLTDAAKKSGVPFTNQQREAIVDELVGVLKKKGFVVKENERLYTGEEDIEITQQNAPKLKTFLDTIAQKNPQVFKLVLGLFNRGALDISSVAQDIADNIPSTTTVADPEPEEDQTDTVTTEPVDTPDEEDQEATIATEPVAAPDDDFFNFDDITGSDQEDQTDTTVTEPVAAPDPEEEAVDFDEFFLSLDDETLEELFSSVEKDDIMRALSWVKGPKVVNHFLDSYGRINGLSARELMKARERLFDDINEATTEDDGYPMHPDDVRPLAQKAQQKLIAVAKDILAKGSRLTEHKQLKRMKVLAGIK